jgi:hypothetical protein
MISKYHFVFIQTYASYFVKEILPKCFILNKCCISKNVFENEFQILFYKVYSLNFKGLFLNPISILEYANTVLWAKHIKHLWEISLSWKLVSYSFVLLCWILEKLWNWFELIWSSNAKVIKKHEAEKKKRKNKNPDDHRGPTTARSRPIARPAHHHAHTAQEEPPALSSLFLLSLFIFLTYLYSNTNISSYTTWIWIRLFLRVANSKP